jgi:hypothetical protein
MSFTKKRYENFKAIEPIISIPNELGKEFLRSSLLHFFDEMELYLQKNEDYAFWTYQHERTFLSMYLNGIIRNDFKHEVTLLQEYGVWDKDKKYKGRCDVFINHNKNAIFLEAKRDFDNVRIKEGHWHIPGWLNEDNEKIGKQLSNYYSVQKQYISKNQYSSCQLVTLVFKLVKTLDSYKHVKDAQQHLGDKVNNKFPRGWFYTFLFDDNITDGDFKTGLEIYGTIKTMKL